MELFLYNNGKAVNGFAHICVATGNVDVLDNRDIAQQMFCSARSTACTVYWLAPSFISRTALGRRMMTAAFVFWTGVCTSSF